MFCEKCGKELNENEKFCPSCGAKQGEDIVNAEVVTEDAANVKDSSETVENNSANETATGHVYVSPDEIRTKVHATALLVISIVETIACCCSGIGGILAIIALILYFVLLERDIKAGDLMNAKKSAKIITILLCVAPVVAILTTLISFAVGIASGIFEMLI